MKVKLGTITPVPDLPIGSIGWSLGPQSLGGLRPRWRIFLTLLLDFNTYLCCHNVLYFRSNPSVIFLTQLHSISEYCRIINTPIIFAFIEIWLNTLPSSSSREGGESRGVSQVG
jgi:hypothetical protein